MEELQSLLRNYNLNHLDDMEVAPWSMQYCEVEFPRYWQVVYSILEKLDRKLRIIEIGCGLGDVTTIPCYLGFNKVISFEKNPEIYKRTVRRLDDLFNRGDVVYNQDYPGAAFYESDLLLMVNCAYANLADSKDEYLALMLDYYNHAGKPRYFIMEVIDSSYTQDNAQFPRHIRLSKEDVESMFPGYKISAWETYKYPINKKSKTLYWIEKV